MTAFDVVIGLEVHAQLATQSKLFCPCATTFGKPANHQTCPVCLGMPGALPVLNEKAVELAARLGLAVGADVHLRSVFARKNYFYPDLPKGYQISQFDLPICTGGGLWVETDTGGKRFIGLTRIHMEEDAGMSSHHSDGHSRVDLNRAGVPLAEIVSEPDLRSPEEAIVYLKALRSVLRYTEVSDGNMDEGSFRCDANISLRPPGQEALGTKVEIKNINSFKFVGQALRWEIERQTKLLEGGEEVQQQTRRWDVKQGKTVFMRGKEEAHDYRYFPEPDLKPLLLEASWLDDLRAAQPELAESRIQRFVAQWGIPAYDAGVLTAERALAEYFEEAVGLVGGEPERAKALSNWIMGEVLRRLNEEHLEVGACPVRPDRLVALLELVERGDISGKIAKKVFDALWTEDAGPAEIVEQRGWKQLSDPGAIDAVIRQVLADHPGQLAAYQGGKEKLFGFFVGQVMQATRGQANPGLVNVRLKELLSE